MEYLSFALYGNTQENIDIAFIFWLFADMTFDSSS